MQEGRRWWEDEYGEDDWEESYACASGCAKMGSAKIKGSAMICNPNSGYDDFEMWRDGTNFNFDGSGENGKDYCKERYCENDGADCDCSSDNCKEDERKYQACRSAMSFQNGCKKLADDHCGSPGGIRDGEW